MNSVDLSSLKINMDYSQSWETQSSLSPTSFCALVVDSHIHQHNELLTQKATKQVVIFFLSTLLDTEFTDQDKPIPHSQSQKHLCKEIYHFSWRFWLLLKSFLGLCCSSLSLMDPLCKYKLLVTNPEHKQTELPKWPSKTFIFRKEIKHTCTQGLVIAQRNTKANQPQKAGTKMC